MTQLFSKTLMAREYKAVTAVRSICISEGISCMHLYCDSKWRVQARASPLSPTKWQEMLRTAVQPAALHQRGAEEAQEGSSPGAVVLDVRNAYEWDAGHFIGAERPLEVPSPMLLKNFL